MRHGALRRPREPGPDECCGSGCTRCVWDVYFDQVMKYNESTRNTETEKLLPEDDTMSTVSSGSSCEDAEDRFQDYVGSVVVKYIVAPGEDVAYMDTEKAASKILGRYAKVEDVHLLKCSAAESPTDPTVGNCIRVMDVFILNSDIPNGSAKPELPLPGDVVDVFVPNDFDAGSSGSIREVERLCKRSGIDPSQWCELHQSPFVPPNHFPPWLPHRCPIQIRTLLAYFVDIGSCSYLLRPTFLQALLRVATSHKGIHPTATAEDVEKGMELLKACASNEVSPFIFKTIVNDGKPLCFPRLLDVLDVFSFVNFPIARLLEVSGPLRPRKFSVVDHTCGGGSHRQHLKSVQLCIRGVDVLEVSNVESPAICNDAVHSFSRLLCDAVSRRCLAGEVKQNAFNGHVSHPLCNFRARHSRTPLYLGMEQFGKSLFAKELASCVAPAMLQKKVIPPVSMLILVGAGTGMAPLMSAINELTRHYRSATEGGQLLANPWVIYGARTFSELVFHQELQRALEVGIVSRYDVALSRNNTGTCPKYITDVLELQARTVKTELVERGARLFACGPVEALRSLRERLKNSILSSEDDDGSAREQRIRFMEEKKQLMFDVWSTVNIFE
uniref:Putative oxidoreductase-protein n=1 Tax=Trypanosoma vivax (strain Y486) TaxID=1055687 RepID=G0U4Y7_TRYVY|nr:putative oxidoreductase-protein [Trypanosoma vivax Y486]